MMTCRDLTITRWGCAAQTARDLMTPNPLSISEDSTVREAAAFLIGTGFSAAPVINEAGRPVGVLSRTDIVRYQGECVAAPPYAAEMDDPWFPAWSSEDDELDDSPVATADAVTVREIMTPTIVCVGPETPVELVVRKLAGLEIHRLFVVDGSGVLVGVVSTLDVLRSFRRIPTT